MENIRFVLIVILAMISLMLWEAWQADYGPQPEVPMQTAIDANGNPINIGTENNQDTSELPLSEVVANNIISVNTDVYQLEIDTQGGTLRNLDLLDYTVVKGEEQKIRLFDSSTEKLFLGQSGLLTSGKSVKLPNHNSELSSAKTSYELKAGENTLTVPLTWTDGNGLNYTKTYTFTRGSYVIGLDQKIDNQSANDWTGRQYTQLLRVPHSDGKGNTFIRTYSGAVVYTEEDKYQKIDFDDMAEEDLKTKTIGGWSAMIQHYFATAWVPPAADEEHYFTKELSNSRFVIGSYSNPTTVAANTSAVLSSQLFIGPKIQPMMEAVAPGLELTVDYSWLTIIGKPIYALLNWIHDNVVNNWGFSIMGVTLCIKALFFPLSAASYKSMAKMRKLQPRLAQLKESYGDDRQRFNEEMMSLYRKEKVNPMGGCLPIMVQIPVFISLYWVLIETVELRQAPFLLWVHDLSAKDPFFVLPVVMGITMFLQQRLNPAPVDPLQAKIMRMFPIVFTVFFLFFPAGLVLYWVTNNTLSIMQQWYITNKIVGKEPEKT
ncbi:membrane protein insertase YidC [Methylococcaceae bacterium HT1]|nr:membrane protein insertase YidC [Methyloprofundus sp.]TXK95185.1 membrane protein insertase YidC [Methylococcaceae bacterium CS4]TXK96261.1 membrane protein insertase YidC [Methylococcaceae bacterium CS5]TXK99586.1 membrane protein insertase YidC [Methylococcaceae bacterium HT1]TXL06162.1 membrane protein insertase YidC [Methylococcaceae bacterium CS1]TXL06542.1 membrane protein insertase YidC [Methylococcaceae bacterium CS3]TXL09739.1 membrane protein insertase YidC [Methylococcaceae bact